MKILFSSSDLNRQLQGYEQISPLLLTVFVDRPFGLRATQHALTVTQGDLAVTITPTDLVIFLLFRAPHELIDDSSLGLEVSENFALLADACDMLGVPIINQPAAWEKAYSKIALFRIAGLHPGLVPAGYLLSGPQTSNHVPLQNEWIVKSGFGIKRPVNGLLPRYEVLSDRPFAPTVPYRYLIQQYVASDSELRVYVTRSQGGSRSTIFAMPVGKPSAPDWRDYQSSEDLECTPAADADVSMLAVKLAEELSVQLISFDFVRSSGALYLLDINPHGSWYWLPPGSRAQVDQQVSEWLSSL